MESGINLFNMIFKRFFLVCMLQVFLHKSTHGWVWNCDNSTGTCNRVAHHKEACDSNFQSLEICKLVCGEDSLVWPKPYKYSEFNRTLVKIDQRQITFTYSDGTETVKEYLKDNVEYFKKNLKRITTSHDDFYNDGGDDDVCSGPLYNLEIVLQAGGTYNTSFTWDTSENYTLRIWRVGSENIAAVIAGDTIYGVRHGIETLLQLILPLRGAKNTTCPVIPTQITIEDAPAYRHRGLLLDTGRNFLSVEAIKRNILAMAASKLNVLHWHITDSQSFPLESKSLPNMTKYGAYSSYQVYTPEDIKNVTKFAWLRGVRVLLEIDGPSHAGNGWQWGAEAGLGDLAVCVNKQPWRSYCIQPPCGQLNPANPNLYEVMGKLYKDILELLPGAAEAFHMGGDEVFIPCWNSSQEIRDYLKDKPLTEDTFLDMWSEFQAKALSKYDEAVGHNKSSIILWTSSLTDPRIVTKYLSKDRYVIQTWVPGESELPDELLDLGYKLIISTKDKWYLDHGFWGSTPYYNWRKVYENKISEHEGVLGGEVCMWGELVDDNNIESRIWPRAAAAAERLWSNPSTNSVAAESRFYLHRERLIRRGVDAEAVMPKWCVQNVAKCSTYLLYG